ncbi:hypothetical protein [Kitasatospora cinereorecta]|uniref:Uncharacterized protein n=1 Tax=Kitasatospora cinereorecta TaxID=285560 RepID=A0ABW0VQ44_9ACTN
MSTNRSRRIDRHAAERLLGGGAVGSEAGQASLTGQTALAELLAAAKADAAPAGSPLPGEEQAMAAFRAARHSTATRPTARQHRRRTMADTALARAFSAKALAAALAATAVGGVAVAASTGNLPTVLGGGGGGNDTPVVAGPTGHATRSGSASAGSTGGAGDPSGRGVASGGAKASPGAGDGSSQPGDEASGKPSDKGTGAGDVPDLAKLCKIVQDRLGSGAKARDLAAEQNLQPLFKEAGGAEKVAAYCATLPAGKDGGGSGGSTGGTSGNGHDKASPSPEDTKGGRTVKSPTPTADQKAGGSGSGG